MYNSNETYPSNIKLYQIQMFIGKGAFGDVSLINLLILSLI